MLELIVGKVLKLISDLELTSAWSECGVEEFLDITQSYVSFLSSIYFSKSLQIEYSY